MSQGTAAASAVIQAPTARVYNIIADYRQHHPRIVPPEYFRKLEVEEGGVGAGTRMRIEMRVLGTTKHVRHFVREPEPGRVLEEVDVDGLSTTTFVVEPTQTSGSTKVSIQTTFAVRPGPLGVIERILTAALLRRIYTKELGRLSEYARTLP